MQRGHSYNLPEPLHASHQHPYMQPAGTLQAAITTNSRPCKQLEHLQARSRRDPRITHTPCRGQMASSATPCTASSPGKQPAQQGPLCACAHPGALPHRKGLAEDAHAPQPLPTTAPAGHGRLSAPPAAEESGLLHSAALPPVVQDLNPPLLSAPCWDALPTPCGESQLQHSPLPCMLWHSRPAPPTCIHHMGLQHHAVEAQGPIRAIAGQAGREQPRLQARMFAASCWRTHAKGQGEVCWPLLRTKS